MVGCITSYVGIKRPKKQKYVAQIYTILEISRLVDLARGTDMYLSLMLVCYVGFRRGELSALKWEKFLEKHGRKKICFHNLRYSCTPAMGPECRRHAG